MTTATTPAAGGTMSGFTGTGALLRLAFRTDRVRMVVWVLSLTALAVSQVAGTVAQYPTQADLARLAATFGTTGANPALVAVTGPVYDATTYGGATAWQVVTFQTLLVGLMSLLLVVRHTRAEEEAGRAELVHSAVVGRYALPAASVLYVLLVNAALAALTALGFVAYKLPVAGSVAIAVGCGLGGLTFAAVALLSAQLTEQARTASGLAGTLLGVAFLLRAVGDSAAGAGGGGWLSWATWASPIGWAQQLRPYAGDRWWTLLLPLALILALLVAAMALVGHRDVAAGLLPPRLGEPSAPPWLRSPLALAWRLQRGSLLGWTAALFIAGASFGGIAQDMEAFGRNDPSLAETMAKLTGSSGSIVDLYLAYIFAMFAAVVAVYAVQAMLRMRAEETGNRAEPVLATAVTRVGWVGGHALCAAAGSAVVLAAGGLGAGLAHGLRTGDLATAVPRLVGAALVPLPAVWLLAGVGLALFGLLPRAAVAVAWAAVGVAVVIDFFGPVLNLRQPILDLSPFVHLPKLPGVAFQATPLAWLLGIGAVLAAAGLVGFRRRDLSPIT
ncbi:MAG TPA: ABC transporter permease [Actinomycetes bacterium]|nr:ABC transporter permease [Actinomycetes bacterium]